PTHPGEDVTRTSASLIYNHDLGCDRSWQTAFVWGRNSMDDADFDSYLVESSLKQDGGWSPFFRYEWVDKSAEELVLPDPPFEHEDTFTLQQGTVGLSVDLGEKGDWQWGLGGAYVFNLSPNELDPVYGSNPDGWTVFLRAHPRRMKHDAQAGHGGHGGSSDGEHAAHMESAEDVPAGDPHAEHESAAQSTGAEQHAEHQREVEPAPAETQPEHVAEEQPAATPPAEEHDH
nr:hypothetical protein [bacterium]